MAFRVSWNALSDVARAIGADSTAALLYPIVVDGLMALALIATLVLTGPDRKFALRVLATYTLASLLLNYVHGLIPALHSESIRWGRLADWDPANWALVLLATSLPVGSIYFGSDLVAKVLHHTPESADSAAVAPGPSADEHADESAVQITGTQASESAPDLAESDPEGARDAAPVKEPTEGDESASTARSTRSVTVAESTGTLRRPATGRVPVAAKPTADRLRTEAEVLEEARILTASWSDDSLTAERLRNELRVGQNRARAVRDQLRAERSSLPEPVTYDSPEGEPLGVLDGDAPQQQRKPATAPSGTA
ncbi:MULTISPECIES: DUF2637 domain-containing protein [Streptomyces]|nr:Protein of unknown function [Streptomyces sp. SolWspMP-5a-2]